MRLVAVPLVVAISAVLLGCAGPGTPPGAYLRSNGLAAEPRRASFDICRSIGCMKTGRGLLSESEWTQVRSRFTPPPADSREERARAARAVGLLGEWFDPASGTRCGEAGSDPDSSERKLREERARAGLLSEWATLGPRCDEPRHEFSPPRTSRLDCIAEASNTTVYLMLLQGDGLLPRHRVRYPAHRGFLSGNTHNTAVLEEVGTGRAWAVDSWYGPAGGPAPVWPLELWLVGQENEGNRENAGPAEKAEDGVIQVGRRR